LSKTRETRDSLKPFLFACCSGLSPSISLQFTLKMCTTAENRKKINKTAYI